MTTVKICGITRLDDALAAVEAGADALGFNFEPGTPRYVGDRLQDVQSILEHLPRSVSRVIVTGDAKNAPETIDGFTAIQWLLGDPPNARLERLRVYRIGETPIDEIVSSTESAIVLDSFHREKFGGTGEPTDWNDAAKVVSRAIRPVILAGGLTPENVAAAVKKVSPSGVDVSSGVESAPGIKDVTKIQAFVAAAKSVN